MVIVLFLELAPQEKKSKPKRQLGILEMAVEEFGLSSDVRQLIPFKLVINRVKTQM